MPLDETPEISCRDGDVIQLDVFLNHISGKPLSGLSIQTDFFCPAVMGPMQRICYEDSMKLVKSQYKRKIKSEKCRSC